MPPTGTSTFFTRNPRRDSIGSAPRESESTTAARTSGSDMCWCLTAVTSWPGKRLRAHSNKPAPRKPNATEQEPALHLGLAAGPVTRHEPDPAQPGYPPEHGDEILHPPRSPGVVPKRVPGVVLARWHIVGPRGPCPGGLLWPVGTGDDRRKKTSSGLASGCSVVVTARQPLLPMNRETNNSKPKPNMTATNPSGTGPKWAIPSPPGSLEVLMYLT